MLFAEGSPSSTRIVSAILVFGAGALACGEAGDLLSNAGLYDDPVAGLVAAGVEEYQPAFELWSDGAAKRRYLKRPEGHAIDKSEPDRWIFPVGTKFFKEFSRDGVRVEPRLIERTGPSDFKMVAYLWRADGS